MSDKDTILKQLDIIGVDAAFIIQEMFLGYKYRKHNGQLYNDDADIPTKLILLDFLEKKLLYLKIILIVF